MCGLVGAFLYPQPRPSEALAEILSITTANLVGNEERGQDAAGIAVMQSDGSRSIYKQPVSASALVNMSGFNEVLSHIDRETVCILGHTRMPTKGSRWNNDNNHPILAGPIVGVHNGMISNDDALFDQLQLPRSAEVDSEIIFRILAVVDPGLSHQAYAAAVQREAARLQGCFATLSVDLRHPTRLLVLKHLRPLCLHYEPALGVLFFSSRYIFLRRAFGKTVSTEALDSGYGYVFDAERLPECGCEAVEHFPLLVAQPAYEGAL